MKGARGIALLALLAALISFGKFQHCRSAGWGAPDVYVHMCYSDLSALYGAREINLDNWPYASATNSVEYPVITGIVMWATGLLIDDPNGYRSYFDLNAMLIALLLIAAALILWRIKPEFGTLFLFAPAAIASLYINWDLWAVVPALLAVYYFQQSRYDLSALALGISIATKFFPLVLLLGVGLHFLVRRDPIRLIRYSLVTSISWAIINIPVAVTNFDGWSRFYKMNIDRGTDLGSIWYAFQLLDRELPSSIVISIFLIGIAVFGIGKVYVENQSNRSEFENFALAAFLAVAVFVTVSKVYSPQYILWLTPLALIAMRHRSERSAFWIWQGGEAIYHVAIWQYLATYTGAKFGLPENLYAFAILIRVATLIWFSATLIRGANPQNSLDQQPTNTSISR
jgi:hypothetical protein